MRYLSTCILLVLFSFVSFGQNCTDSPLDQCWTFDVVSSSCCDSSTGITDYKIRLFNASTLFSCTITADNFDQSPCGAGVKITGNDDINGVPSICYDPKQNSQNLTLIFDWYYSCCYKVPKPEDRVCYFQALCECSQDADCENICLVCNLDEGACEPKCPNGEYCNPETGECGSGCTDVCAPNYNSDAYIDDESCEDYPTDCDNGKCDDGLEVWPENPTKPSDCKCITVYTDIVNGCTDPTSCAGSYNPNANCDDGSCVPIPECNLDPCKGTVQVLSANECKCIDIIEGVLGCMDPTACNYDVTLGVNCDDGSCETNPCTDPCSSNYNPDAVCEDNSTCAPYDDSCNQDCSVGAFGGVWDAGTCSCVGEITPINGCMDSASCNYMPDANCDPDNECEPVPVCNTDPCVGDITEVGGCDCDLVEPQVLGCMDNAACNFNPDANCDDGSCVDIPVCNSDPCVSDIEVLSEDQCSCELSEAQVLGCTNPAATNYNENANCDDESCILRIPMCFCPAPIEILGCTTECAENYNPEANVDDGSCIYEFIPFQSIDVDSDTATGTFVFANGTTGTFTVLDNQGNVLAAEYLCTDPNPSTLGDEIGLYIVTGGENPGCDDTPPTSSNCGSPVSCISDLSGGGSTEDPNFVPYEFILVFDEPICGLVGTIKDSDEGNNETALPICPTISDQSQINGFIRQGGSLTPSTNWTFDGTTIEPGENNMEFQISYMCNVTTLNIGFGKNENASGGIGGISINPCVECDGDCICE